MWVQAISEITRKASSHTELADLYHLVAEAATRLTYASACAVQIASADGRALRIEGQHGLSTEYVSRVNAERMISLQPESPYYESPSSQAYRTRSIVIVEAAGEDISYSQWREVASAGLADGAAYRSLVAVPMAAEGEIVGVLAAYSLDHDFSTSEFVGMITILAEQTALAITLARVRDRDRANIRKLLAAHDSLQHQQLILEQAENLHHDLMRAVLNDGGLHEVLNTTASVLSCDLVLEDLQGNVRNCASGAAGHEHYDSHRLSKSGRAALQDARRSGLAECVEFRQHEAISAWVVPLNLAGDVVAWLWAFVKESRAAELDLQQRALEQAALAVRIELWHEQSALETEWRLSGDLLDQLLEGKLDDDQTFFARALNLGYDLSAPHSLVLIATPDGQHGLSQSDSDRRSILGALEYSLRDCRLEGLRAWRNGSAALFLSTELAYSDDSMPARVKRLGSSLLRYLPHGEVTMVLSTPCRTLNDYSSAYRAASGAMALPQAAPERSGRSGGGVRLLDVSEMGMFTVLLGTARTADLLQLRNSTLGSVKEYDARKGASLLETLRTYMQYGCKIKPTAEMLSMHPNTVSYRLKTIEKLTGLIMEDVGDLLQAQLAILIDDFCSLTTSSEA